MSHRLDENSAPIFSNEVNQPYARRSVGAFMWFIGIIAGVAFLSGWFFTSDGNSLFEKIVPSGIEQSIGSDADGMSLPMAKGGSEASVPATSQVAVPLGNGEPIILPDNENMAATEISAEPEYFNGKILDFEGNVAGDIAAIERNDGDVERFIFVLDKALAPEGKAREYSVPKDEVQVIQKGDVFVIQLSKEQTAALAAQLYTEPQPE